MLDVGAFTPQPKRGAHAPPLSRTPLSGVFFIGSSGDRVIGSLKKADLSGLGIENWELGTGYFLRSARFLAAQPSLLICRARAMASESAGTSSVMELPAPM